MVVVAISVLAVILLNGKQLTCHENCFRYLFPNYYQLSEVDFTIWQPALTKGVTESR